MYGQSKERASEQRRLEKFEKSLGGLEKCVSGLEKNAG